MRPVFRHLLDFYSDANQEQLESLQRNQHDVEDLPLVAEERDEDTELSLSILTLTDPLLRMKSSLPDQKCAGELIKPLPVEAIEHKPAKKVQAKPSFHIRMIDEDMKRTRSSVFPSESNRIQL